ncbi:hypothetical protein DL93DRAFT_2169996 [Clavulina sp. PMI_390]|nr:hypothetical protein DL93DRAFT_2169996 [Clavulina sp. PMI_390]
MLLRGGSERSSATRQIKHAISEVSKALDIVSLLEAQIQELRISLHSRKTSLMQSLSPASGLPNELLSIIFDLVIGVLPPSKAEGEADDKWRVALQLSHVCRRWRAATTTYCKLWASIAIRSPLSAHLMPLFAERSGPLRLAVSCLPRTNSPWKQVHGRAPIIPLDERLIREVVLGAPSSHLAFGNHSMPGALAAEPLDSLTIKYSVDVNELQRFSSARTIRVENGPIYGTSRLYMPRLEEFVLYRVWMGDIPRTLGSLHGPRLRHLQIINVQLTRNRNGAREEGLPDEISPDLSNLHSLSIINTRPSDWFRLKAIIKGGIRDLMSGITHLELTTCHYPPFETQMRYMLSSFLLQFPSLASLKLVIHSWCYLEVIGAREMGPHYNIPIARLHTLQLELASEVLDGHLRTGGATDNSSFPARTLQFLNKHIGTPLARPSEMIGADTGKRLKNLTMTRELVGENEAWYRARVREFAVVEEARTLPY